MRFRNFHAGCCGYVPTRSDGSEWGHVLTLRDGSTVYADTIDEVFAELVPGWEGMDEAARRDALERHAAEEAADGQRRLIEAAHSAGTFDPADPQDAAVLPVLEARKQASLLLETPDAPGEQADWLGAVQLILLTTSYRPHGQNPPIGGRVLWLDPTGPRAYLESLRAAGLYDYWTLDPAA